LLTLFLAILPPLAGFALYFCAVHSRRHFQHIWQDITAVLSPRAALMLAGGLTIASWILALALFINQPAIDGVDAAILRSVFILLAALTVPHMLLVDMLFRPHSVAKHSS
jgi:Brp/Blh family beta-carotene 15,15'-monooxygenase